MPGDQPLLEITVGREGFRFGEIAVVVRPGGDVDVRQRRSGELREWHGHVEASELSGLEAIDVGGLSGGSGGPRDPDDEPVVVRASGRSATLRHADRHADPALDELLGRWERLAETVTGGALPYGTAGGA